MHYLYGDSTPSPLTANFLEFLRDALDFSVFVLNADDRIKIGRAKIRALEEENAAELERLLKFVGVVRDAIEDAPKGADGSPTWQCSAALVEAVANAERATAGKVRSDTTAAIARVEADEQALRGECFQALGALLVPHDPPDASSFMHVVLGPSGYEAKRTAKAELGIEYVIELAIPEGPWSTVLRIERLVPQLEIRAPQLTGWISKEVKVKPQRIERYVVTELTMEDKAMRLKLRTEPGADTGFDVVVDAGSVKATRIAPSEGEGASGPFELHPDDYALLADLGAKLRASTQPFERKKLLSAVVEGAEFESMPSFIPFVEKLVGMMAPIVREIDVRSLTHSELILRRPLSDDRREEIFVTKATLREKYAGLTDGLRVLFAPLRLEDAQPARVTTTTPSSAPPPSKRAEVAASKPRSTIPPPGAVPPPANPVMAAPPPPPIVEEEAYTIEPDEEEEAPEKNEALVASLKRIFNLARSGRVEEAYKKYAELFGSDTYAGYKPEEQREALRVMVHAKSHPSIDAVANAHRAALGPIQALVDAHAEPIDYEMLGLTHLQLKDSTAATAAFEIGLKLERTRDPQSDLATSLAKRLEA